METIWLHVKAPFAVFRRFQAGVYKATYPVMPPSAAYGLVLNLAGIEMRGSLSTVTTSIRPGLPEVELAIGLLARPTVAKLFQQLHSYPVGETASHLSARTHGAKYFIAPVRRELLVDYNGMIGLRTRDRDLVDAVRRAVCGEIAADRYGLPFLGDNNFLIDQIEIVEEPPLTRWYSRVGSDEVMRKGVVRLTVGIDRSDNSQTLGVTMAPLASSSRLPPESGWIQTPGWRAME